MIRLNYRYKGRHRSDDWNERSGTRVGVAIVGSVPLALLGSSPIAVAGPPGGWDAIIQCESSNRNVESESTSSSASGYFQFTDGTWRAFGGAEFAPRAIDASFDEQLIVANRAYEANGLRDWEASRACWEGRQVDLPAPAESLAPADLRPVEAPPAAPASGDYVVQSGDTLSGIALERDMEWQDIWEQNKPEIPDPDLIFPEQTLDLP